MHLSTASPSKLSTPKSATSNTITVQPITQTQSPIQSSNRSPQPKASTPTYTLHHRVYHQTDENESFR